MPENSPSLSIRPKLARILLADVSGLDGALRLQKSDASRVDLESCVIGRYRKVGGALEESARGAQRGLLLILGSALAWLLAIWIGYHFL